MKIYICFDCQDDWELEEKKEEPFACPKCGSKNIVRLDSELEE